MSKQAKDFSQLRDTYAKYPSLKEAEKALSRMEGINTPEIAKQREQIRELITRFSSLAAGINRTEGQYHETLLDLNAQNPVWNEGSIPLEKSAEKIENLGRYNQVLTKIGEEDFGGNGWVNTLKEKDENVREFLRKFIGPVGQKERVEAQIGLRPSENEKKLVAYFSQKNPVEIDKFFKSDEYKALKKSFLKTLENTGEDKQVFCLTQFAKALTLETEAERKTAVEALQGFDLFQQDLQYLRVFESSNIYKRQEIRKNNPDTVSHSVENLEGKGRRAGKQSVQDSLRELYKLLSLDATALQYAPSIAIIRLLRQGRREELGLSRENIFEHVSYNEYGGYFNFAHFDDYNFGKIISNNFEFSDEQHALIMSEFKAIIRELLPALNALQSKKSYELGNFMNKFAILANLKEDFQYENGEFIGSVIQSNDTRDKLLNEVSAQIFQENLLLEQKKQQQAREILLGKKGKVPEDMDQDALLQVEPGEYTLSSVLRATKAIITEVEINLYNKVPTYRMSQMEALLSEAQELKSELQELITKKKKSKKQLEEAGFFQRDLKDHLRQQIVKAEKEANSKRKDIAAKVEECQKIKRDEKIDSKLEAISKLGIVIPTPVTPESGDVVAYQQELLALVKNGVLDNVLKEKKAELDKRYENLLVIKRSVENTIDKKPQETAVTEELEILKRIY